MPRHLTLLLLFWVTKSTSILGPIKKYNKTRKPEIQKIIKKNLSFFFFNKKSKKPPHALLLLLRGRRSQFHAIQGLVFPLIFQTLVLVWDHYGVFTPNLVFFHWFFHCSFGFRDQMEIILKMPSMASPRRYLRSRRKPRPPDWSSLE